ncbi:LysR family transcriptional regulator [Reinekea sp.]|jgi:DNA-binding transcriptional LysR family regulator|uniref:LysR family transcriptional regulator n=1 Tax=Reinekea sp. TaxID=1970455 RepID=UPI002A805B49|nr:LysR family transcriptional regulator [Reinekea sp.]
MPRNSLQSIIPRPVSEYDLRLLRIFKVVVECGGFAAAESVLNITRSTISVHMSNLEGRMKVRLAKRGRGGFSLTEEGRTVYEAMLVLFRSLNDFSLLVSNLDNELEGEIGILCSDQVALTRQLKLPQVIAYMQDQAPNLQPAINADTVPNIERALLSGDAHIGIMPEYRIIDGLDYQPCYSERFYLCVGSEHPLYDRPDAEIEDPEIHACQTVHPGVDVNFLGIEQFRLLTLAARAYQFDTRTPLVLSGKYLGFFPLSYIQGFLDRGEVRLLQPERRFYSVDHVMVTRHSAKNDPKVRLFFAAYQQAIAL